MVINFICAMENPCQPNLDLPKTLNSTHLGPSDLDRTKGKGDETLEDTVTRYLFT
jgi:hypothetical protein